ncbi:MAG: FAD-dependent oxidoreductase, partial [Alistipes sp.]|nr:FAD-dependent oxidoreductase [Alistipes sp.]
MQRENLLKQLENTDKVWDFVVVGGGATGLGCAVDAASRGYSVALFEREDFAKCTSSRSTKLVHGGVRYLQKGDVALVREAVHERGRLRRNAPHLVKNQSFLISNYSWWD